MSELYFSRSSEILVELSQWLVTQTGQRVWLGHWWSGQSSWPGKSPSSIISLSPNCVPDSTLFHIGLKNKMARVRNILNKRFDFSIRIRFFNVYYLFPKVIKIEQPFQTKFFALIRIALFHRSLDLLIMSCFSMTTNGITTSNMS